MKIAVSSFGDTIATTFDFADEIVVFTCLNGQITDRQKYVLGDTFMPLRAQKLKELGIDTLICGAISRPAEIMLRHHDIEVITGITGNITMVVNEIVNGDINQPQYRLPGFTGRLCGRGKKRRRRYHFRKETN